MYTQVRMHGLATGESLHAPWNALWSQHWMSSSCRKSGCFDGEGDGNNHMQSNLCKAARTPCPQISWGAFVNELTVVAHGKLYWCFKERRQDTCLLHIWPLSLNKDGEWNLDQDRVWSSVFERVQHLGSTGAGGARMRHKLPAGTSYPLTQNTPRKSAFYPVYISQDEQLCLSNTAEMLGVG